MKIKKTKIGGVEIRRTYRPARIICDVVSLAVLVVIVMIAYNLITAPERFEDGVWIMPLLFPAAGIGLCAAYVVLTFKSLKFKRYKITGENAQSVYDWWAFLLSLAKVPLLLALFEGEYQIRDLVMTGEMRFGIAFLLYLLLTVIIIRLMTHRIKALTAVKKARKDESTVKVKARIADDNDDK